MIWATMEETQDSGNRGIQKVTMSLPGLEKSGFCRVLSAFTHDSSLTKHSNHAEEIGSCSFKPVGSDPLMIFIQSEAVKSSIFIQALVGESCTTTDCEYESFEFDQDPVGVACTQPDSLPVAATLVGGLDLFMEEPASEKSGCFTCERGSSNEFLDEEAESFRDYQSDQWMERFRELCDYKRRKGHCIVPHNFEANLPLARWVKRQRYLYKQIKEGLDDSSSLTSERVCALESIGFVWDCQAVTWTERLHELCDFQRTYGHCSVPASYPENPRLAVWVKCQRRQYMLFKAGKRSSITKERIRQLESLGFSWGVRSRKRLK